VARISVIVPTRNGGAGFVRLLEKLRADGCAGETEIIVIDSGSRDGTVEEARRRAAAVIEIAPAEFDHGGTRNRAVRTATGEIFVFLPQDALPADGDFLGQLTGGLGKPGEADAAYGRQMAAPGADPIEAFSRFFNYPPESSVRTGADLAVQGVRACFFSNTASAVTRGAFERLGGFESPILTNEDMEFAYRLLDSGGTIAYRPGAVVYHSHSRGLRGRFRRYVDIGVFFSSHPGLRRLKGTGGEGLRFLRREVTWLLENGKTCWLPVAACDACVRYAGFRIGRLGSRLPRGLLKALSAQPHYW